MCCGEKSISFDRVRWHEQKRLRSWRSWSILFSWPDAQQLLCFRWANTCNNEDLRAGVREQIMSLNTWVSLTWQGRKSLGAFFSLVCVCCNFCHRLTALYYKLYSPLWKKYDFRMPKTYYCLALFVNYDLFILTNHFDFWSFWSINSMIALQLLLPLRITLPHKCAHHLFTPNPTGTVSKPDKV